MTREVDNRHPFFMTYSTLPFACLSYTEENQKYEERINLSGSTVQTECNVLIQYSLHMAKGFMLTRQP